MKKYVVMNNSKTTAQDKRQDKSLKERVADAIVALYIITALLTSLYSMLFGSWGISFGGIVWTSLTTYGTFALYRAIKRDWH